MILLFRKLKCMFGFHRMALVKPLSPQSDMIACCDCQKRFAINYSARIVLPWDRELEKFYIERGNYLNDR
jgi:hypothetical protein